MKLCCCLCSHVLHHCKHHFLDEALSYIALHLDGLVTIIPQGIFTLKEEDLNATLYTVGLVRHLSLYKDDWRINHPNSLHALMVSIIQNIHLDQSAKFPLISTVYLLYSKW